MDRNPILLGKISIFSCVVSYGYVKENMIN